MAHFNLEFEHANREDEFSKAYLTARKDVYLDENEAIDSSTEKMLIIKDSICTYCLGIAKLPAKQCPLPSCNRLYCSECYEKLGNPKIC